MAPFWPSRKPKLVLESLLLAGREGEGDVDDAAFQSGDQGPFIGEDLHLRLVDQRPAGVPVVRVLDHRQVVAGNPLLDLEGAGAGGLVLHLFQERRLDDRLQAQGGLEVGGGLFEGDLDGGVVGGLDVRDGGHVVEQQVVGGLGGLGPLQVGHHVLGRHRVAGVVFDALADLEGESAARRR